MTTHCLDCDGLGWHWVGSGYADRVCPSPDAATLDALDEDRQASALHNLAMMRRAANNSVYPCQTCQPISFSVWAGRHWDRHHDAIGCEDCQAMASSRRPRRSRVRGESVLASGMPDRRDLE